MIQIVYAVLALLGAGALGGGGTWLWMNRPDRPAVSVNGRVLTERELGWRAQTLLDDAKRMDNLLVPKEKMEDAMNHFRRTAAKMWIVKEVLLAAAVESGLKATPKDEQDSLARLANALKSRNLTPEQFFAEGPIPEKVKRTEHMETVLIEKYLAREIEKNIKVSGMEIEEEGKIRRKANAEAAKAGREQPFKTDRRSLINAVHGMKYNVAFRKLFRERFARMQVQSPAFPDLEKVDGVSPPREEDKEEAPKP